MGCSLWDWVHQADALLGGTMDALLRAYLVACVVFWAAQQLVPRSTIIDLLMKALIMDCVAYTASRCPRLVPVLVGVLHWLPAAFHMLLPTSILVSIGCLGAGASMPL